MHNRAMAAFFKFPFPSHRSYAMSLYVGSVPFRAPPPQFPAPPEGRLDGGEGVSEEREREREREGWGREREGERGRVMSAPTLQNNRRTDGRTDGRTEDKAGNFAAAFMGE